MIRARLIALREQRMLLVTRAQDERERLAGWLGRAQTLHGWITRGRGWLREAGRRPLVVAAIVGAIALLRPRRMFRLLRRGLWLWGLYREARPHVARALAAFETAGGRAP